MAKSSKQATFGRSKKDALIEDLSKQVEKLGKRVKAIEKERDALLEKADRQKAKAKKAVRSAEKQARKEIKKARQAAEEATDSIITTVQDHTPAASHGPDASWTVAQLRAEARKREIAGYSRMTKAQLIAVL
jgi:archaellum component FlaC